jgi:hypothetical protein
VAGLDPQPSFACGAAHILRLRMLGWRSATAEFKFNSSLLLKMFAVQVPFPQSEKIGCAHAIARRMGVKGSELKNFLPA